MMKILLLVFLFAVISPLAVRAAVGTPSFGQPRPAGIGTLDAQQVEPSEVPPHRGMSKEQVHKLYGAPDTRRGDPSGETWFYFFNKNLYLIPFYYGRPRTAMFHFNEAGVLTDFQYRQ